MILSHRSGESILICYMIEVTTLRIDRNRVCVGIRAPKHIDIVRQELVEQENKDV